MLLFANLRSGYVKTEIDRLDDQIINGGVLFNFVKTDFHKAILTRFNGFTEPIQNRFDRALVAAVCDETLCIARSPEMPHQSLREARAAHRRLASAPRSGRYTRG